MTAMTRRTGVPQGQILPPSAMVAHLYEQQAGRLYAYALRRVREPTDADDVVAESFRRAIEHLDRYEQRHTPIAAWLYRIARHFIADQYRRTVPLARVADVVMTEVDPGPEQAVRREEQGRAVRRALTILSPAQRQVLWLRYSCVC